MTATAWSIGAWRVARVDHRREQRDEIAGTTRELPCECAERLVGTKGSVEDEPQIAAGQSWKGTEQDERTAVARLAAGGGMDRAIELLDVPQEHGPERQVRRRLAASQMRSRLEHPFDEPVLFDAVLGEQFEDGTDIGTLPDALREGGINRVVVIVLALRHAYEEVRPGVALGAVVDALKAGQVTPADVGARKKRLEELALDRPCLLQPPVADNPSR